MTPDENPMDHPQEQPPAGNGSPRFGRLLIVLVLAVVMIGVLTFVAESYYTANP